MKRPIWLVGTLFLIALIAPPAQPHEDWEARLLEAFAQQRERLRQEWAQRTPYPTPVTASERPRPWATRAAAEATAWRSWQATRWAAPRPRSKPRRQLSDSGLSEQPEPSPQPISATPVETMQQRVYSRDIRMLQEQLLANSLRLAETLPKARAEDFTVEKGDSRSIAEVAGEILSRAGWL